MPADQTCASRTVFGPPSSDTKEARKIDCAYRRDGARLTMQRKGAGQTVGDFEGDRFVMDNHESRTAEVMIAQVSLREEVQAMLSRGFLRLALDMLGRRLREAPDNAEAWACKADVRVESRVDEQRLALSDLRRIGLFARAVTRRGGAAM